VAATQLVFSVELNRKLDDSLLNVKLQVGGVGSALSAPILGSLSDDYGRKPILMAAMLVGIIPPGACVTSHCFNNPSFGSIVFMIGHLTDSLL
jgi:MFS family permease